MSHNEVGCYSYADAESCRGDVLDCMTILASEPNWNQRGRHIRHFIARQDKLGRGVVVIYSTNYVLKEL